MILHGINFQNVHRSATIYINFEPARSGKGKMTRLATPTQFTLATEYTECYRNRPFILN